MSTVNIYAGSQFRLEKLQWSNKTWRIQQIERISGNNTRVQQQQ